MPVQTSFGYIAPMPNAGSEHQTAASLMIDTRYAMLRIVERWSWERYVRLCQFLRMTPFEVASLALMSHEKVERFHRDGRLSGPGFRAVGMVLTLIEGHVMAKWTDDIIKNPFPDLNGGLQHDGGAPVDGAEVPVGGSAGPAGNASAESRGGANAVLEA